MNRSENLSQKPIQELLKAAKRLKKDPSLSKASPDAKKHRIAVLSTCSIQHFTGVLRLLLDNEGIASEIYEGEYDGINMDVLDDSSPFYKFDPEIVILLMRYTDLTLKCEEDITKTLEYLKTLWSHIDRTPGITILQSNFATPPIRAFGGLEGSISTSPLSLMHSLNLKLAAEHPKNVQIIDTDYLSSYFGKHSWFDEGSYFLTKQPFNMDYIGPVASDVTNAIKATLGFTKKCLVLDLDNTLWGGVVGDEGPLGINVDPNNALGEAYRHFQKYILSLKNRGVILAVNSKNDEEIAKEPFEQNPDMLLKLDDFAAFVANWEDKASNLRLIAETLNIGIDSLVFFDDNPAEREIVRSFCPEVTVIDVPEAVEAYADALDRADAFRWAQITKEDMERSASYTENRHRDELRHNFVNYNEYLTALEMKGKCDLVGDDEADRFTQLINKSNQFNLRTQRYSSGEIDSIRNDGEHALVYVSLTDKFTSYGIISCIILEKRGEDIFIDTWCMSCRVLKRSVEDFAFKHLIEIAKNMGGKRLIGEYLPTKKNGMVRDFYRTLGFTQKDGETEGTLYEYDLSKEYTKEIFITKEA